MRFPRLRQLMLREEMSERFQGCWFDTYEPVTEENISKRLAKKPWLPDDYIEFLRLTDGAQLEMFVFYGTAEERSHSLYSEMYGDDWHPIGHEPSGDAFVIHRSGSIATIGSDPPPDEPVPLCQSFHELIENVCCGQGYVEYFRGGMNDSDWCGHLRKLGWVS